MDYQKITNDSEVKWITTQRLSGGEWTIRYFSINEAAPYLDDSRVFDETPIGEMRKSEFAIFRNRPNAFDYSPRSFWRGPEVPIPSISASVGNLINSRESDHF